jgi:hypothetical protein
MYCHSVDCRKFQAQNAYNQPEEKTDLAQKQACIEYIENEFWNFDQGTDSSALVTVKCPGRPK